MSKFIPHKVPHYTEEEMRRRVIAHYEKVNQRRSVREFSSQVIPRDVIEHLILSASTAPSGAHKQPWTFVAVSNSAIKKQIREAAEQEEYENYHGRMTKEWLQDLEVFETNWKKPFLEIAPWLIIVFRRNYEIIDGERHKNYYVSESVGLATGMLLTAIHNAGLVALTHTPSPMNFLSKILERPENEKPFLLIPIGYAPENCQVPDLHRKGIEEIAVFKE